MTLDEFFERLPKDGWWMSNEGAIRRGNNGQWDESVCECPVSSILGKPTNQYMSVATSAGISRPMAANIATAADGDFWADEKMDELRARLVAHCGLKE